MNQKPLVSIITITFNAERFLERTIQSVISQSYPNIEYLIIDGKSTDNTLDIIKKYEDKISLWISEADKGLYDAMNKGLSLAKGDFVWFMNAGDQIYAKDTLEKIFSQDTDADIYYGETDFFDLQGNYLGIRSEATPLRLPKKLKWQDLQMGLLVCHQAILVRKSITGIYDLKHPYSADIDWVIRCLKKAKKTIHTKQIIAIYLQGGYSRKHLMKSLLDRFSILQKHFGFFRTLLNHLRIVFRSLAFILRNKKTY